MVQRVPVGAGEKESLRVALDRHRDVVRWKIQGLDDEQLRRSMTPSGSNLIGLVKHLAAVEYSWFCQTFGRPTEPKCAAIDCELETDDQADLTAKPDETTQEIVEFYERACAAADAAIDEIDLDALGTSWSGTAVTMRWVLIHMVEEVARHAGHMDIIRELIDGATGDHDWPETA